MDDMDNMDWMDGGDRKGRPYRFCGNIRGGRAHPLVCLGEVVQLACDPFDGEEGDEAG